MDNPEVWLADTMIELADSLSVGESAYLDLLARRLSELVAPAEVGLLVTTETGSLTTRAASTDRMRDLLAIETRVKEGPCTTCHGTGQQLLSRSLGRVDPQWPRFGPAARRFGYEFVSARPLRRDVEALGAVCVLDSERRPADDLAARLVTTLVDLATIGLVQQRTLRQSLRRADQLQHALDSRVVIEQAKGIVAARSEITPDAAFERLRDHARRNGLRLVEVANDVVLGRLADEMLARQKSTGSSVRSG